MTRDHAIRIAVRGLVGEQRRAAIETLCMKPAKLPKVIQEQAKAIKSKRQVRWHINWSFNLTAEQYLLLRETAKRLGISMAAVVRQRVFGEGDTYANATDR